MKGLLIAMMLFFSVNLFGQVRDIKDIPADVLNRLDKMGIDNSPLLNGYESAFLNAIFKDQLKDFNFADKKVGFLVSGGKMYYFDMQKKHYAQKDNACDNGVLYVFDESQKKESGGYDAAILCWSKFLIPSDKIVERLKIKEQKSTSKKKCENCKIKSVLYFEAKNDSSYSMQVRFNKRSSMEKRKELVKTEMIKRHTKSQNQTICIDEYLGKKYNEYRYEIKILGCSNSGTEIDSLLSVSESFERMMNRTESWSEKCHLNIFSILNEVSFEEGKRLQIDLSEKEVFRGECRIFASDGHNLMEQNYMKYVKLKHLSCSACWQWILLHNIECFLPTSGLGSYKKQRMVLTDEEWQSIITKIETVPDSVYHAKEIEVGVISESQHNEIASIKFPSLQVRLNASLRTAEIAFCTWNDWQGLALNHFFLRIKDDYSVEVSNSSSKIIVPYDCGILF